MRLLGATAYVGRNVGDQLLLRYCASELGKPFYTKK